MASTPMAAADAAKLFRNVTVQTATAVTVKDEKTGKTRSAFKTDTVALKAEHILAARRAEDGTVSITTVDGKKYSAAGKSAE